MKIIDIIKNGKKFFSLEVSPPPKNKSISNLFNIIEKFLKYDPAFISITYHPLKITKIKSVPSIVPIDNITNSEFNKEYYQKKHAHPLGISAAIKYKFGIEVMPHFVCAGMNKSQVEEILTDFSFLGIENVLALRGDPALANEQFHPIDGGYRYAEQLVQQINEMKHSLFMNTEDGFRSLNLCVGVAGYPEKHLDAESMEKDILNLKNKIDAGAEFIITQMCFDFDAFIHWIKLIRAAGIQAPVIPGIKPLTSVSQLLSLKYKYKINIPEALEKLITSASNKDEAYDIGIQQCVETSQRLLETDIAGIHYYTMGSGKDIEDVVKRINIWK